MHRFVANIVGKLREREERRNEGERRTLEDGESKAERRLDESCDTAANRRVQTTEMVADRLRALAAYLRHHKSRRNEHNAQLDCCAACARDARHNVRNDDNAG